MFVNQDPAEVLERLASARHPLFAEADLIVDCTDEHLDGITRRVEQALSTWRPPRSCMCRWAGMAMTS